MTNTHDRYGAPAPVGRTQPARAGVLRRLRPARGQRGFSMVELVVSFAIFLVLASVISLALGRSFSTASGLRSRTQAAAALSDELTKLAAVPYADLLADTFRVPDPCPDAGTGIAGDSCVKVGTQQLRIAYGYRTTGADTCSVTDAKRYAASYGYVVVNGCVVAVGRGAFTASTAASDGGGLPRLSRQINAPRPGFKPGAGAVRVQLSGDYADLPGDMVLLIHPAAAGQPASQVSSGIVDGSGVATITVDDGACTTAAPCALGLSVGGTPTETAGAGGTLALVDTTAAGAGAGFAVPANAVTEVTARVSPVSSATLDLVALKNGVRTANPVPGSVCLWVTFPDIKGQRSVPVCNTANPGRITIDTYEPDWRSFAGLSGTALAAALGNTDLRTRYPFPAGTTLRLSVDDPDGTCPYAPGMVASQPGNTSHIGGAPSDWSPLATCSSFTWGAPSRLELTQPDGSTLNQGFTTSGAQLTLDPSRTLTGAVVWDNALLAPGVVGYGPDTTWDKPRHALGCSADASCTSTLGSLATAVADPATGFPTPTYPSTACLSDASCREAVTRLAPEAVECPGSYCYSTVNSKPVLSAPATGTQQLSSTGTTTSFTLDVRDSDDPAATITAAVASGSPPASTTFTLGTPSTVDAHTVRYPVTFTDSTGTTDLKVVTLALSSGSGTRAQTSTTDLGLYYNGGAWRITGNPVTAAQGATNVPVAVQVTGTNGAPYPGAVVTFSSSAPGAVIASATSDASGYATGVLTVPSSVAAGSYTISAAVSGSSRTGTIPLRVTGTTGGLNLAVDDTTVNQGQRSTIRVQATDGAGGPVAGVVVTTVVTDGSGAPSSSVYPASTGCVTSSAGTCAVPLVVDKDAPAGSYTVGASSGTLTATPQAVTVAAVPTRVTSGSTINIAQGQTLPAVALTVLDGAGKPIPNLTVGVSAPAGLSVTPASGTSDDTGAVAVALTAAGAARVGTTALSVTIGSATFAVPVTVAPSFGGITAPPTFINQGSSGQMTVTVSSGNGDPVPGTGVNFFVDVPGITFTPYAVTDSSGRASTIIDVDPSVHAGAYPVTASVAGQDTTLTLTVSPVPASITASGAVNQGETSPLNLSVLDLAGDPIPNQSVSVTAAPATFALDASTHSTDSNGVASYAVTDSGTVAGVYTLTVTAGPLTTGVPVTVVAVPGQISLGTAQVRLTAGGTTTLGLTVTDRAGQPYPGATLGVDGVPDGGTSSVSGPTDAAGHAVVVLRADSTILGGVYPLLVSADSLTVTSPMEVVGTYSAAELRAGATMLLPLDDDDTTARDLLDRHAGTYVGGSSSSFSMRRDSTLPGSEAVGFQPLDPSGNLDPTAAAQVHVADGAGDLLPGTGSFSLSAWVNPRTLTGSRSSLALVKGNPAAGTPGLSLGATNSTTAVRVTVSDGTHTVDQYLTLDAGYQPSAWVGKWTHVVLVVDRAAAVARVYVNGVRQSGTVNLATVTGSLSTTADLVAGAAGGYLFDGQMDEVAAFGAALTDGQVGGLYQAATATDPYVRGALANGPVGYWRLDDTAGTTAKATVGANGTTVSPTLNLPALLPGHPTTGLTAPTAYATLPAGSLASADSYTLLGWFYPTAASRTVADGIFAGANINNPRLTWGNSGTAGTQVVQVLWNYADGQSPASGSLTSGTLALNSWHQVAVTVSKAGSTPTVTLFVDGQQAATTGQLTRPIKALGSTLYVGARDSARGLPGRLAELRGYDRSLSGADISGEYSATTAAAASQAATPYAEAALGPGPVGYWRLDETSGNAADSSGYGAAGTVSAGTTRAVTGLLGTDRDTAISLPGTSGNGVSVPYNARTATATFSVATWVKVSGGAGSYRTPVGNRYSWTDTASHATGWNIYAASNDTWQAWAGNGTNWAIITGPPVALGQRVFLVETYDGTTLRLYVNGTLAGSLATSYTPNSTSSRPLTIGSNDGGSSYPFPGVVDDTAVYPRALTATEVTGLFQAGQ